MSSWRRKQRLKGVKTFFKQLQTFSQVNKHVIIKIPGNIFIPTPSLPQEPIPSHPHVRQPFNILHIIDFNHYNLMLRSVLIFTTKYALGNL